MSRPPVESIGGSAAHQSADAYVEALGADFADAAVRLGRCRHDVMIGPHHIRVDVAGTALDERLGTAFAHLVPAPNESTPALTIIAWDRATAGRAATPPPWDITRYAPLQRIAGLDPRQLKASYDLGHGILSLYRPGSRQAVFYAASAADIPRWVARMPFRQLLGWWAEEVGMTLAHAAVVGRNDRCVLIPGASGSGKSTTALACSEHGLDFIADDLCLLDPAEPRAYALYQWAKAEAATRALLPDLEQRIVATEAGQSVMRPANLVRSARVAGIVLPTIAGGPRCTTRPATAAEAAFALGPSTLVEGNGAGPASLAALTRIARTVPVAHLDLCTDMADVAASVERILEGFAR